MEATSWWTAHRRDLNAGLALAAFLAFAMYAYAVGDAGDTTDVEITPFTIGAQFLLACGYALAVNAAYSFAPWLERKLAPGNPRRYRRSLFAAGLVLATAPFLSIPILCLMRSRP